MPEFTWDTWKPTPDAGGVYSISREVEEAEKALNRELTPEEFDTVRDRVLATGLERALAEEPSEPDLWGIVQQTVQTYPEYSSDQLKALIRKKLTEEWLK